MDLSLLWPAIALVGLTFVVWCVMYVLRLRFMARERIAPDELASRTRLAERLAPVSAPANNFQNLLELPVLFYAFVALAMVGGHSGPGFAAAAWAFVGLRAVHSLIHCTYNKVGHRFVVYIAGALVLWGMWAALAIAHLA